MDGTVLIGHGSLDGLDDPAYGDIVIDSDRTVWINSKHGIARLHEEEWDWAVEGMPGLAHLTLGADRSIGVAGIGVHRLTVAED